MSPRVHRALVPLLAGLLLPPPLHGWEEGDRPPPPAAAREVAPDTLPDVESLAGWLAGDEDRPAALAGIRARAASAPPDRATLWIQLLSVVERVGPEGGAAAVRAVGQEDEGEGLRGAERLGEALDGIPEADRPPLLALGALLAEGEDPARAARLRSRLLAEFPDAQEAPEAQLRQARWLLGGGRDRAGALELLESLVVNRPFHSVAPEARRLLQAERRAPGREPGPPGA